MKRTTTVLLLAVLLAVPTASAQTVATLDANTPLTDQSTIDKWHGEASAVTVQPTQLQLSVTIAEEPETVGLSSLSNVGGATTYYIQFDYDESISRSIRIYVPDDYWTPYPDKQVESENTDHTAEFAPTVGENYTAVTVDVDGPAEPVFAVNRRAGWIYDGREYGRDLVRNTTGVDVPSFTANRQWQYLKPDDFGDERGRAAIESGDKDVVVQYDDPEVNGTSWVNARECSGEGQPVCTFAVDGDKHTYVLTRAGDPPRVRYKIDGGLMDKLGGSLEELTNIGRSLTDFGGWF